MASLTEIKKKNKIIGYKFRGTYIDADGKRVYKSHSWYSEEDLTPAKMRRKAQAEADEWEINLRAEAAKEVRRPQEEPPQERGMTFQEYFTNVFLPTCVENRCRPITMNNYTYTISVINKKIGSRAIAGITQQDTRELLQYLEHEHVTGRGKHLDKSTIRTYYTIYKQVIKKAMEDGTLTEDPLGNIKPPKVPRKPINTLNQQEIKILADYTKNISVKDRAFVLLCMFGGFRKNEVIGLKWEDIDFNRMQINVVRGVTAFKGGLQIAPPKTESGQRIVPMLDIVAKALKELYGEGTHDPKEYIFHSRKDPYYPAYPSRHTKLVKECCASAEVPDSSPHDLRHTYGSALINNGVDIKMVSTAMGHSDTAITYRNYVHVQTERIAENVNRAFNNIMGVTA